MKPIISIGPGQALSTGLFPSVNKGAVPMWADGRNVIFTDTGVEKAPGMVTLRTMPANVRALEQATVSGDKRLYIATENELYIDTNADLNAWSNAFSSAFGTEAAQGFQKIGEFTTQVAPVLETWGSFLLLTDKQTKPKYWPNAGQVLLDMPTPFEWAKIIKRKDVFVLGFNTSEGGNAANWCSASNILDWDTTTLENSAGSYVIRDLESDIVAVTDLGNDLSIYSNDTLVIGRYLGLPNIFGFRAVLNGIGAVSARSVVSVGALNVGLSQQGVFLTDGSSFDYVDDPGFREEIIDNMDIGDPDNIIGYLHETLNMVIWSYKAKSGDWAGLGYNRKKQTMTKLDYQLLAAIQRNTFNYPIGAVGKRVVALGQGYNRDVGVPLESWVRTRPLDAGDEFTNKLWEVLRTTAKTGSNGRVRLGVVETTEDEPEWIYDGELSNLIHIKEPRESPYIVIEYHAEELDEFFRISSIVLEGEGGGPRNG